MNFLLAGDSWGIGVFENIDGLYQPTGKGIHSILESLGHNVVNISKAGASNRAIVDRLYNRWLDYGKIYPHNVTNEKVNFDFNQIDFVIFIQTDILRDYHYYNLIQNKVLIPSFYKKILKFNSLGDFIVLKTNRLYMRLNRISQITNKKILCIGGWSKLHESIEKYPNLVPVIASATEEILGKKNIDSQIVELEWFLEFDQKKELMNKFADEIKLLAINATERADLMCRKWKDVHPDLNGYQYIVQKILESIKTNELPSILRKT